jgi:glucuronate isomerase
LLLPAVARAATSTQLYSRLLKSVESVETIDTHEHILPEAQRLSEHVDFFTFAGHYVINDLHAAGMPFDARKVLDDPKASDSAKWKLFGPWWEHSKFTGYSEALRIAVRDLYGLEISGATLPKINAAIASRNKAGLYADILKKRMRLRFAVNDQYWASKPAAVDGSYFVLAQKFDGYVMPVTPEGVRRLEAQSDSSITSLAGLKAAMTKVFEQALRAGMATVKSTAAYQRSLDFAETSEADASRDFDRVMKGSDPLPDGILLTLQRPHKPLADHMFHHLASLCDAHDVPFQIHTGMQAGNSNVPANSQPLALTNLFHKFGRVQFDLFHIGYPWWRDVLVLAKMYPNVNIDFCWMHVISPTGARAAMHEMLDSVPVNKIFGYGGDYRYPELSYGHLILARRNIARVLAERVEAGQNTEEESARLGRMLMLDNPARLFKVGRVFSPHAAEAAWAHIANGRHENIGVNTPSHSRP